MLIDESILEPRRRGWLRWLVLALVVALVVALGLWIAHPFGAAAAAPVTARATTGTIVASVDVSGTLAAATVDELDFGASGTVSGVAVAVGDQVTKGQVLATLDSSTASAQLAVAQANLASAQARLADDKAAPTAATVASARDAVNQARQGLSAAEQNLADTKTQNATSIASAKQAVSTAKAKLAADQAATPAAPASQIAQDEAAVDGANSALQQAETKSTISLHGAEQQVASARLGVTNAEDQQTLKTAKATASQLAADEAAVASAQLAVVNAQASAGGSKIVAPIDGTVTAVSIAVGQSVGGGGASGSSSSSSTGQIEVMDLAHLVLDGEVSDVDVSKLKGGQAATVTADALGTTTLTGKVCGIDEVGTAIQGVTSYGVTVCLDEAASAARVGMSADASVIVQRHDGAVLVPSLAVQNQGGRQVVDTLGPDGKTIVPTAVETGLTDGQQTEIATGLASGAVVVLRLPTSSGTSGAGARTGTGGAAGGGRGGFPQVIRGLGGG